MSVHSTRTELNWPASCNQSTQLLDAFVGHVRQRHGVIGCSETRTVGAHSILNICIPMRLFALELASWSSVHISSCAVNKPLRLRYERAQRGDERVCLCACLSVSPRAYLRNFMPDLHHIFVLVACDRDRRSVLLWRRCDTFSTSGFMNDVIFAHSGPSGCVSMLLQSDVTASSCAG